MAEVPNDLPMTSGHPTNPGTIEDLHSKCKSVYPGAFEGAKLLINKGLNQNFQVSHTLTMSNALPAGYRFGATYVGSKMLSLTEGFPLLMADLGPSGDLNANIIHAPTTHTRVKMMAQIQNRKWMSTQLTADWKGKLQTASLTLGNPDLIHGQGVGVFHYLRAITPRLSLGGELAYQASPQIPGGHVAVFSGSAKVTGDACVAAATLGNGGQVHATFYQKCSENLAIGVEMETNFKAKEAVASIGYEFELPKTNFVMRGCVDTDFVVKAVIEKKLMPLPFTLALSSLVHQKKHQYQFGLGLIIG